MGGTDDPSNLVELTVEEHAEAHRKLFEKYGKWEDEVAWKGLAGIISKKEATKIAITEGARKAGISRRENNSPEVKKRWAKIAQSAMYAKHKEMCDENMRKTARATYECKHCGKLTRNIASHSRHEKRCGEGFYDIIWVTNGWDEKQQHKDEPLEEGWFVGRFIDTFTIDDGTRKTIHGGEFTVFKRACPNCERLLDSMWYKRHINICSKNKIEK